MSAHARVKPLLSRTASDLKDLHLTFVLPREYSRIDLDSGTAPSGRPVYLAPVVDKRDSVSVIGRCERPEPGRSVYTSDTVSAWFRTALGRNLVYRGMAVGDSSDSSLVLRVTIEGLLTTEGKRYETAASIDVSLFGASGEKIFTKKLNTCVSRWGRSYKAVNYQRGLSEAVFSIAEILANDADLRGAVRTGE